MACRARVASTRRPHQVIAHVATLRIVGRALTGGVTGEPVLVMTIDDMPPTAGEWIRATREAGRRRACRETRLHGKLLAARIARAQASRIQIRSSHRPRCNSARATGGPSARAVSGLRARG